MRVLLQTMAVAILLTGCVDDPATAANVTAQHRVLPGGSTVFEIRLSDGTPCAVINHRAISCGWKQ